PPSTAPTVPPARPARRGRGSPAGGPSAGPLPDRRPHLPRGPRAPPRRTRSAARVRSRPATAGLRPPLLPAAATVELPRVGGRVAQGPVTASGLCVAGGGAEL